MSTITSRWNAIYARVCEATKLANRKPEQVRLVAVSKTHPAEAVVEAFRAGARDFGENRVQEFIQKRKEVAALLGEQAALVRWHFIGGLQSRKVKGLDGVNLVHSLDRSSLLDAFDKHATAPQAGLIQVNIGSEFSKGGVAPDDVPAFAEEVIGRSGVVLRGLMTIPPRRDDLQDARRDFDALANIRQRCIERVGSEAMAELSMGMSHDFEVAIAAGATMVRVGTAIFGART